jgi:phosphocarrier protein HPr
MKEYEYTVVNELGMHARPAGQFVRLAQETKSKIEISKGAEAINAVRILAVMSMNIRQGDQIQITVEGSDEDQLLSEIKRICKENL